MSPALLGLDFGQKRIGVAVVQGGTNIALPVGMIERKNREQVLDEVLKLIRSYRIEKLVVGLPKTLKGEMGPAAEKLTKEMEWFREKLPVPLEMWDERLSTKEVERVLIDADVRREKRKEVIDQLAAQRILQNYLDHASRQTMQS
jgi:putative Holliday junction resolvase